MGSMRINFAEVESGFDPLPAGPYPAIIDVAEIRASKSSENHMIYLELKVTDGEHEGRRLFNRLTFTSEKALWKVKDTFVNLGVCEPDEEVEIEWDDDVDIGTDEGPLLTYPELEGAACIAMVSEGLYEGRMRNQVDDLLSPNGLAEVSARPQKTGSSAPRKSLRRGSKTSKASKAPATKSVKKPVKKSAGGVRSRRLR